MPSAPSRPRLLTGWEGWRSAPLISSRFRKPAPPAADVVETADTVEVVEGVRLCGVRLPVSGRRIEQKFNEQAKCAGPPPAGAACALRSRLLPAHKTHRLHKPRKRRLPSRVKETDYRGAIAALTRGTPACPGARSPLAASPHALPTAT